MEHAEIKPGMELTWWHEYRGGYGYGTRVPVTVRSVGPKRVRIEAPLTKGGTKLVTVPASSLSLRNDITPV